MDTRLALQYDNLYRKYLNGETTAISIGELLSLDINNTAYVKYPSSKADAFFVGVAAASSDAGQPVYIMNRGIVQMYVDNTNGAITSGDPLTTKGGGTGIAIKSANFEESIIARALEAYDSATPGIIQCEVSYDIVDGIYSTKLVQYIGAQSGGEGGSNEPNIVTVSKTPGAGDFGSIKEAIDSIVDASESNTYIIYVQPGLYVEEEIAVPSWVYVNGADIKATKVQSDSSNGGHHVFKMSNYSGINFLSIHGGDSGFAGIYCEDTADDVTIHKVHIESCDIPIYLKTTTDGLASTLYLEYVDIYAEDTTSCCLKIESDNVVAFCNAENFYIICGDSNPLIGINTIGEKSVLELRTGSIHGVNANVGTAILISGGELECLSMSIDGFKTLVSDDITSSSLESEIEFYSVDFGDSCDKNLVINNTKTYGHYTGYIEYDKKNINAESSFFITEQDSQILTVAKIGGNFSSIKSAIDSLPTSGNYAPSETHPYAIQVGPGIFTEEEINVPPYVMVIGSSERYGTTVVPSTASQNIFVLSYRTEIKYLNLKNAAEGYAAVKFDGGDSGASRLVNISFDTNHTCVDATNANGTCVLRIYNGTFLKTAQMAYGVKATDSTNGATQIDILCSRSVYRSEDGNPSLNSLYYVSGSQAFLTVDNSQVYILSPSTPINGTGITVVNGATMTLLSSVFYGLDKGVNVENSGTMPIITINSTVFENCNEDIRIDNENCFGSISAISSIDKIIASGNSATIPMNVMSSHDKKTSMIGNLEVGNSSATLADITNVFNYAVNSGVMYGGELTKGAELVLNVASGYGYISVGSSPNSYIQNIEWNAGTTTLTNNKLNYIYIDSSSTIKNALSKPDLVSTVFLGCAITIDNSISYIMPIPKDGSRTANKVDTTIEKVFGSIFESGCITTEINDVQLAVGSGSYYYGTHNFTPSGGSPITFDTYRRDGSGGYTVVSDQQNVDYQNYDNNGVNLTALDTNEYARHSLYIVNDGTNEKYLLLYGQTKYSSLIDAQNGILSPPNPNWVENHALIASIIVKNTSTNADKISDVIDERPLASFRASASSSITNHGELSGLLNDDHTQYLLVNGSRSLSGNLNIGSNNITNATLINGVNILSHQNRHIPGGSDAIPSGTPSSIGITNAEGISNVGFARIDHIHAHGNQIGGTLHSEATTSVAGFMSAADKTKIDLFDPLWHLAHPYYFTDFDKQSSTGTVIDWLLTSNGTAAGATFVAPPSVDNSHGIISLNCGTQSTGRASINMPVSSYVLGQGVFSYSSRIYIPTLSTAAQEYRLYIGLYDATTGVDAVDGVYFKYDRATYGAVWVCTTSNNSTRTNTTSAINVVAGTWHKIDVIINATATSVAFYLNGNLIHTETQNIPSVSATKATAPGIAIAKSVGNTATSFYVDYWYHRYDLTNSR